MKVNKYVGFIYPVLLAAVLVVLTPKVSFGGLAEMAKAKAAEALTGTVMKEVDKKIADAVGKKPISEKDKANITKKLSGAARPIVKKIIDGAVSGQLPSPAEVVSAVIKDILPQVDELATAIIEAEREKSAAAAPSPPSHVQPVAEPQPQPIAESNEDQPRPSVESQDQPQPRVESHEQPQIESHEFESPTQDQPIFQTQAHQEPIFESPSQPHQQTLVESQPQVHQPLFQPPPPVPAPTTPSVPQVGKQNIVAVYVTGGSDVGVEVKESVAAGILNAIVKDKKRVAIENSGDFLAEVDALRNTQTDNAVYDSQISEIGAKFGVSFVCVAEITTTSEAYHVLARMIDVQTAEAVSAGNAFGPLKSEDEVAAVSGELVKKMAVGWMEPPPSLTPEPAPAPVSTTPSQPHHTSSFFPEEKYARASMNGFSLGCGLSQDAGSETVFLTIGFVHSRPVSENVVSFNVECDFWVGSGDYKYKYYDGSDYNSASGSFDFLGGSMPLTFLFQVSVFSFETGAFGDVLFADDEIVYNAGFVVGGGLAFDKKRALRFFYRYNGGYNYGTHVVGMWWLF